MPLLKTEQVSKVKIWAVWEIQESIEEMFTMVDMDKEEKALDEIKHPKKKQEWLGSRIIAKYLCDRLGITYQGIVKDEFGKPWLRNSDYFISVSHKYPFVTVLLDGQHEAGIDVEPVNPKIDRIAPKFVSDEESKWANNSSGFTIAWAAKEALYKVHGRKKLIFKKQLVVQKVSGDLNKGRLFGKIIDGNIIEREMTYERIVDDLYIVYTL